MNPTVPFDYSAWQDRMGYTNAEAADALDISQGMFFTLRREGKGRAVYAWAAYGRECAKEKVR